MFHTKKRETEREGKREWGRERREGKKKKKKVCKKNKSYLFCQVVGWAPLGFLSSYIG